MMMGVWLVEQKGTRRNSRVEEGITLGMRATLWTRVSITLERRASLLLRMYNLWEESINMGETS